jgi:hypothetical protein
VERTSVEANREQGNRLVIAAAILALGMLAGAIAFGMFFEASRSARTVQVTGAATRTFESDIAKWRLNLSRPIAGNDLTAGYAGLGADVGLLVERLRAAGVPDSAIHLQPVNAQPQWNRDGERSGFIIQQPLFVLSSDVDAIEGLALAPGDVLPAGVALEYSQLEYFFSGIAELKHSLLADATRDAQARAQEIVGSTDGELGEIAEARAGVFQITEPFSTEVSGGGMHSTTTRRKEITVTVHARFELE